MTGVQTCALPISAASAAPSRFRGLARDAAPVQVRTFDCAACENTCEIQQVTNGGGRRSFFGSVCGRFERGEDAPVAAADAFATRDRLRLECAGLSPDADARPAVPPGVPDRGPLALPFALSLADHLPFWGRFLSALGYRLSLSGRTDAAKTALGLARVPEEFCQPVKVLFGHVHDLVGRGATRLFVPHLRMFRPPADGTNRYACAYTQAAPYVVRAQLQESRPDVEVLALETPVPGEEAYWVAQAARTLGLPRAEVQAAFDTADRKSVV